MANAKLIKALRCDGTCHDECPYSNGREWCDEVRIISDAADALEADDERIAELEADKKTLIKVIKDKSVFHATKDAMRIAELEAQLPKEGAWKKILQNDDGTSDYQCSACLGIIENVPDDDEHPLCNFCPNCGAKMKDHADGEKK